MGRSGLEFWDQVINPTIPIPKSKNGHPANFRPAIPGRKGICVDGNPPGPKLRMYELS